MCLLTFKVRQMPLTYRPDLANCTGRVHPVNDRRKDRPDRIVIHRNTAGNKWARKNGFEGSPVEALHHFHAEPGKWSFRIFPYHYFIDESGEITKVHDELIVSPHARNRGNWRSIGIALNIDGRKQPPTQQMHESLVWLCSDILFRWPNSAIMGHSAAKRCPGPLVNVSKIETEARDLWASLGGGIDQDKR
jgi:hypothetical protein